MSLAETSKYVGFSTAKLSMMENALQPSAPVDIMALGYIYEVPTPEWQSAVTLTQWATQKRATVSGTNRTLFDATADFARLHAEVARARLFASEIIPDVLQTHDYALAALTADDPLRAVVKAEQRRSMRTAWQARIHEHAPLAIEAVITESAIRRVVGSPRIMNAQLAHLAELSQRPNVTIQVITHNAGAYPAMGRSFAVLSFPHPRHDDVVYVEILRRGEYVEDRHDIERCAHTFAASQHVALPPDDSVKLISDIAGGSHTTSPALPETEQYATG